MTSRKRSRSPVDPDPDGISVFDSDTGSPLNRPENFEAFLPKKLPKNDLTKDRDHATTVDRPSHDVSEDRKANTSTSTPVALGKNVPNKRGKAFAMIARAHKLYKKGAQLHLDSSDPEAESFELYEKAKNMHAEADKIFTKAKDAQAKASVMKTRCHKLFNQADATKSAAFNMIGEAYVAFGADFVHEDDVREPKVEDWDDHDDYEL